MKSAFLIPMEKRDRVDKLADEDAGKLFKMIFAYEAGELTEIPTDRAGTAFEFGFLDVLKKNQQKYEETCEKNKVNGLKGGRPKKKPKQTDELFEKFWSAYPRKSAKAEAKKAFSKITADQLEKTILPDIEKRRKSSQWEDPKYIPYPATYLRNERWNDEIRNDKPKKIVRNFEERTVTDEDFSDLFLPM